MFLISSVRGQTLPTIIIEPASQSSAVGGTIQFEVSASGAGNLAYLWRKNTTNMVNGGNIAGANTPALTLSSIATSDQANYTCWITNSFGSVTSSIATLMVAVWPGIAIQPQNANKVAGATVTFTVVPSGTAPFTYEWYKDGVIIPSATLNAYTLGGLFVSDSGTYRVRVSNAAGTATSSNAVLNVGYAPVIEQPPLSGSNYLGETAFFSGAVAGSSPISLQWLFNGVPLPGQTNSTLTVTNLQESDFGYYALSATNAFGGTVSFSAQLRLLMKWKATGGMINARSFHTATLLLNGKLLVAGGYSSFNSLSNAELYDPSTGNWTGTGSLTNSRYLHTATLLPSGLVLVAGGVKNSSISSTELYDPVTETWTSTNSMNYPRQGHTATLLSNGKVLVAGGRDGDNYRSTAELFDPTTGTWTETGSLTNGRQSHTATLLANGKVLVAGGYNNGILSSAELYDPVTGIWTNAGARNIAHYFGTATLLPNGKLLVVGGSPSGSISELYDPATGMWTTTGALKAGRTQHTATLLPNGQVLVVGGIGTGYLSTAEVYDPVSETWTVVGGLIYPRCVHTTTLLPNGELLTAGGDGGFGALGSAELDDPQVEMLAAVSLTRVAMLPSGAFQFSFTNIPIPGATFTTFSTTNLALPLTNWTTLGGVTDLLPGQFQFTDPQATNSGQRFYLIRSP